MTTDRIVVKRPAYIPVCKVHREAMRGYSTRESITYYRCPVEGCTETAKAPRVSVFIQAAPRKPA